MKQLSFSLTLAGLLALVLFLASCGGNTAQLAGGVDDQFVGITEGEFKAVRYNASGDQDGALNDTLRLQTQTIGDTTTVKVAISDLSPTSGVTMDLLYDQREMSPERVEFGGLVDSPIQLYITKVGGVVALGQVSVDGAQTFAGDFATITFRNQPFRQVSATGDSHSTPINAVYDANGTLTTPVQGFELEGTDFNVADPISYTIFSIFATGDGDFNGITNIADLTPIGQYFSAIVNDTNLSAGRVDYDGNGEVNIADLTPIGQHFLEQTDSIEVVLGDAADATNTVIDTFTWESGTTPTATPSGTTTVAAEVWRTWTGDVSAAEATAADTNSDQTVFISARAVSDAGADEPAFPGIPLTVGGINPAFAIDDFTFRIEGATGGSGTNPDEFEDGDTAVVTANETVTISVTSISGTYNGTPFTPADAGGSVPQNEYDDALAAYAASVSWSVSNAGAAEMEATADVLVPNNGNGTSSTAVVFPDDDPDSTAAGTPEGVLNVVQGSDSRTIDIDVTADPVAAVFSNITSTEGVDGNNNPQISVVNNTDVIGEFDWGSGGVPGTIDGNSVDLQLFDLDTGTVAVDYDYVSDTPDEDGEFTIKETAGIYSVQAFVSPSNVVAGNRYAIRLFNAGVFSSINKPGKFLVTAAPPPAEELFELPLDGYVGASTHEITFLYQNPMIRRSPQVTVQLDESIDQDFPGGFADILKQDGDEFSLNASDGGALDVVYPQLTVIEDNDHNNIDASTVGIVGLIPTGKDPHKIVVNIDALPDPSGLETSKTFAYKFFGPPAVAGNPASRPTVGFGTFTVQLAPLGEPAPVAINWSIDAFDGINRGDLTTPDYGVTKKTADTNTFVAKGAPGAPDTIFVEFNGGHVGYDTPASNTRLNISRDSDDQPYLVDLDIRIAGLGVGDLNYIGIYPLGTEDLQISGFGGNLVSGASYNLILDDPTLPDATFVDQLFVTTL